jgi:hypothetical protein
MSITAIFTGLITIAKAVPRVADLINQFYDLWIDYQIQKIDQYRINKREKRTVLMKQIRDAQTNEERKALSIILADINRL